MQTSKRQLLRQQVVLKSLNLYNGPLDGIWGPESIKAKLRWEHSASFKPALPSGGLPFANKPPYPNGYYLDSGLLYSTSIESLLPEEKSIVDKFVEENELLRMERDEKLARTPNAVLPGSQFTKAFKSDEPPRKSEIIGLGEVKTKEQLNALPTHDPVMRPERLAIMDSVLPTPTLDNNVVSETNPIDSLSEELEPEHSEGKHFRKRNK